MFGMPQTLPQGWIYVKGNVPFQTYYGNEHDTKYDTYYVGPKGEINPHGPYKYTAGSKKSSKQNKKKTKRSSKQNKKKTKKTKVLKWNNMEFMMGMMPLRIRCKSAKTM